MAHSLRYKVKAYGGRLTAQGITNVELRKSIHFFQYEIDSAELVAGRKRLDV
jgi:hypothetical protein